MRYLTWWHSSLTVSLYEKGFITCRCSEISDEPISWEREREREKTHKREKSLWCLQNVHNSCHESSLLLLLLVSS
jgi:hypothetical protein